MESLKFVMTTTFYPPYHLGGDAVHVHQLSNELAKLGHEVHVIHSIDSYRWQRKGSPKHNSQNHENVTVHSIKSPIGKTSPLISYVLGSPFPVTNKIRAIINEVQPDVLHHHNIAGLGPFILGIKAPKVLYTAHDYWTVCQMNGLTKHDRTYCRSKSNCFMCSIRSNRPPQLWRYTGTINKYMKGMDAIITPSNFMKNKLLEFGLKGNFVTIPNFVPEPPNTGSPLYNYPYILFVGVLEVHKGILELLDSFIDVKNDLDAKLLIVGSGSLEREIRSKIDKNKCGEQIKLLGRLDDLTLSNLYANALCVVIPSIWPENCPLVALEALAHGTPIVASGEGGLPEIVGETNAGMVFKPGDLPLTIKSMLTNSNLCFFTSQALDSSKKQYNFENFMKLYYSILL